MLLTMTKIMTTSDNKIDKKGRLVKSLVFRTRKLKAINARTSKKYSPYLPNSFVTIPIPTNNNRKIPI